MTEESKMTKFSVNRVSTTEMALEISGCLWGRVMREVCWTEIAGDTKKEILLSVNGVRRQFCRGYMTSMLLFAVLIQLLVFLSLHSRVKF